MAECKKGEIYRDGHCKAKPGTGDTTIGMLCNENVRGQKRTKTACERGKFKNACTWVPGKCVTDQGKPGQSETRIPILEEGKLTSIFKNAGIETGSGVLKDASVMTVSNCKTVADYMVNNVKKWNEPGKNPKLEGKGFFDVLLRRTDMPETRRNRLQKCRDIVVESLSTLPPTPRKKK